MQQVKYRPCTVKQQGVLYLTPTCYHCNLLLLDYQSTDIKEGRTGSSKSPKHHACQPYSVGFSASWGHEGPATWVVAEEPMVSAGIPVSYYPYALHPT